MRWEYKAFSLKKKMSWRGIVAVDEWESELNAFGRDGWELVSVTQDSFSIVAFFKRAK